MNELLAQPLAFRVLIDEAMKRVRRHFGAIYPAVAIPLALLVGPYTKEVASVFGSSTPPSPAELLSRLGDIALWVALWTVLLVLSTSALQAAVMDALAGREVNMRRSWLLILSPKALATLFLVTLAYAVSILFCVLPVIYVVALLSLVIPAMVDENRYGFAAMRRSARLARWNSRLKFSENPAVKVLGLFFVGWLLSVAVSTVAQLPLMVAQAIVTVRGVVAGEAPDAQTLSTKMMWFQVSSAVLTSLATTAIQLYTSFGLGLIFLDVRRRREGEDLEAALDALGAPGGSRPEAEPA